jgi:Leucine-rich repeat (LRR) protein
MNINSITSLHNQIQTCSIVGVRLTPNLNDKSNPIYTLTKLQHLELNECEISVLNETISNLTSLQTLLLSNNTELNQLPSSMTKLTSLLHFSLDNTKIQSDTLISVVCQLPSLQVLKLNGTDQLETLPSQISQLTSLQHLSLSFSRITSLPTQIGLLTSLQYLNLKNNKLSFIPTELYCLSNLTNLDLRSNQITHISNQINKLTQLQFLNLSSNRLTQFPDDISSLLHLSELWIDNNKLNQFSSHLPPNLVCLYLLRNSITSISSTTLSSLTRLERLNLSKNQIIILPTQIGLLTSSIESPQQQTLLHSFRFVEIVSYQQQHLVVIKTSSRSFPHCSQLCLLTYSELQKCCPL